MAAAKRGKAAGCLLFAWLTAMVFSSLFPMAVEAKATLLSPQLRLLTIIGLMGFGPSSI